MWIQFLRPRQVERDGRSATYHPGDWLDVGKQTALAWIAEGAAVAGPQALTELFPYSGVCCVGREAPYQVMGLSVVWSPVSALVQPKTLILNPPGRLQRGYALLGFYHLERFDLCAPLWTHKALAEQVGMADDQARTRAVLPDLRVPFYDVSALWVKDSPEGQAVIAAWNEEPGERRLAFLRALYTHPCKVLALPPSWVGRRDE